MKTRKGKGLGPDATFVTVYDSLFRAPTPAATVHVARKRKTTKRPQPST